MSYVKCKGITLNEKENKIFISGASSNVYPITYSKYEIFEGNEPFTDKIEQLLVAISSGELQLNTSLYKWNYAVLKANEELNDRESLWSKAQHKDTIYYIGKEPYSFDDNRKKVEITGQQAKNGEYILNYKSGENKEYYNKIERENDNKRIESELALYREIFMKYFNEKEPNGEYTLYSNKYGYIKPKRTKFAYGYSRPNIKGGYKEMYVKANEFLKEYEIVVKRVVPTNEEIEKELKQQEELKAENERLKNMELVRADIESFKNGQKDFSRNYFVGICKLFSIECNISKKFTKISKNGYSFKGTRRLGYKERTKLDKAKEQLLSL